MNFFKELDEFIKLAQRTLTYERVFDVSGISDVLADLYILPNMMEKEYVNIFYNTIEDFFKAPLYKNLDINKEKDLKFISSEPDFEEIIKNKIEEIKKKLYPREFKLLKYFEKFEPKSEVKLDNIINSLKIDKTSLLFMLDHLKETFKIYDYNGREVTLK